MAHQTSASAIHLNRTGLAIATRFDGHHQSRLRLDGELLQSHRSGTHPDLVPSKTDRFCVLGLVLNALRIEDTSLGSTDHSLVHLLERKRDTSVHQEQVPF